MIELLAWLRDRREGAKYRATYGAASISSADIAAMWEDPDCPVRLAADNGVRHSLDDVAAEFGIDLDELGDE